MESHRGRPLLPRFVRHGTEMSANDEAPPDFWPSFAGIVLFVVLAGVLFAALFTPAMLAEFGGIRVFG